MPHIKRIGVPLIALTGNPASRLAHDADVNIDVRRREGSLSARTRSHREHHRGARHGRCDRDRPSRSPGLRGGGLRALPSGRATRTPPAAPGEGPHAHRRSMPMVGPDTLTSDALLEMTAKRPGHDLRRGPRRPSARRLHGRGPSKGPLDGGLDLRETPIRRVMTPSGVTVSPETLAAECPQRPRETEDHLVGGRRRRAPANRDPAPARSVESGGTLTRKPARLRVADANPGRLCLGPTRQAVHSRASGPSRRLRDGGRRRFPGLSSSRTGAAPWPAPSQRWGGDGAGDAG